MTGTPRIIPGSICNLNAARAKLGTAPGNNTDPTSQFFDLSGNGNHGVLQNFAYEAGNRPRTNSETDKAVWHDLSGEGRDAALGTGFDWTTSSGWAGTGTPADPYCLQLDGVDDLPTSPAFADEASMTVEFWKWRFEDRTGTRCPYQHRGGSPTGGMYMNDKQAWWSVTLYKADGLTMSETLATTQLGFGVIAHQVMSVGGTTLKSWVNGSPVVSKTLAAAWNPSPSAVAQLFSVSGIYTTKDAYIAFRLYGDLFDDADAAQNYAAGPTGTGYVRSGLVLDLNAARAVRPSGWVSL